MNYSRHISDELVNRKDERYFSVSTRRRADRYYYATISIWPSELDFCLGSNCDKVITIKDFRLDISLKHSDEQFAARQEILDFVKTIDR